MYVASKTLDVLLLFIYFIKQTQLWGAVVEKYQFVSEKLFINFVSEHISYIIPIPSNNFKGTYRFHQSEDYSVSLKVGMWGEFRENLHCDHSYRHTHMYVYTHTFYYYYT